MRFVEGRAVRRAASSDAGVSSPPVRAAHRHDSMAARCTAPGGAGPLPSPGVLASEAAAPGRPQSAVARRGGVAWRAGPPRRRKENGSKSAAPAPSAGEGRRPSWDCGVSSFALSITISNSSTWTEGLEARSWIVRSEAEVSGAGDRQKTGAATWQKTRIAAPSRARDAVSGADGLPTGVTRRRRP